MSPMTLYLSAISFQSKASGWANNTSDFRVRPMIEGFTRQRPQQPDSCRPVTPSILQGLGNAFKVICTSEFEASLYKAAAFVLFFGAFRQGEVLAVSRNRPGDRALHWDDCQLAIGRAYLLLQRSKTTKQVVVSGST